MDDRPIVVGIDGSDRSQAALEYGHWLAESLGYRLVAVAAWSFPPDMSGFLPPDLDLAEDTHTMADDMILRVFGENPPAHVKAVVKRGSPAQVLIDASESAAMVVVGSRGHGGFVGMVLGSVGRAVAAHAKCPVVVHHGASEA